VNTDRFVFGLLAGVILPATVLAGELKILTRGVAPEASAGQAVAIDGEVYAIGAPFDSLAASRSGTVYVYSGTAIWRLTAPDAVANEAFGRALSLDGQSLAIGAGGSVYVFRLDGGSWRLETKLTGSSHRGRFGSAVAIEGARLLVGSPYAIDPAQGTVSSKGYVYFYRRTAAGVWELERSFNTMYSSLGDQYGVAVDMDGTTAVVGAPGWGQIFVYRHNGVNWQASGEVRDPIWGSARGMGISLALDGGVLVAGAPGDNDRGNNAGSAYVFHETATGGFSTITKLTPPVRATGARFGASVAVAGTAAAIGSPANKSQKDLEESGAAFVFRRSGSKWALEAELNASDGKAYDWLGARVAVDEDRVLAGAPGSDTLGTNAGATYLYTKPWPSPGDEDKGPPPHAGGPPPGGGKPN
jgi:hypothetical protein